MGHGDFSAKKEKAVLKQKNKKAARTNTGPGPTESSPQRVLKLFFVILWQKWLTIHSRKQTKADRMLT
jgi:hypothetical protein